MMVFVWYWHISNSSKAVPVTRLLLNNLLHLAVTRNTSETTQGKFSFRESTKYWYEGIVLQKPFLFTAFYHWRSSDKHVFLFVICCSNFTIISYMALLCFVLKCRSLMDTWSLGFFHFLLYMTFTGYSWHTGCMVAQQCYFSNKVNNTFLSSCWQYVSSAALGCMQALEMIVGRDKCHLWWDCSALASSIWKKDL